MDVDSHHSGSNHDHLGVGMIGRGTMHELDASIDRDLEMLEYDDESDSHEQELDFVNLDQLKNTIETENRESKKHTIIDVLNQTVRNKDALETVDKCIQLVLNTWSRKELYSKKAEDLFRLLQDKKYRMTIWQDIIHAFYDKPSFICSKVLVIAKRIVECV